VKESASAILKPKHVVCVLLHCDFCFLCLPNNILPPSAACWKWMRNDKFRRRLVIYRPTSTETRWGQENSLLGKDESKVEEWKTSLMSLAVLFQFLCVQHVSDINISIFSSLRLCCWITTSVDLFCKDGWFSVSVNLRSVVVCLLWCVLSLCCSWLVYFNWYCPLSIILCDHCIRLCVVFFIGLFFNYYNDARSNKH